MKARLRVGLAGAGMVSAFHLPAWRALSSQVELIAIADPDKARAAARAKQFGLPRVWHSLDAMLEHERLDAVDLMTPPALHTAHCRAAARAGVAILCQKPLAPRLADAEQLMAELGGGVRLMVHENWRFRPHYRQVKQWLLDGRIGELQGGWLHTRSSGLVANDGFLPALKRQPLLARLPRMMVAEVLVHHLDVMRWLTGAAQVEQASMRREVPQIAGESAAWLTLLDEQGAHFEVSGDMADASAPITLADSLLLTGRGGSIALADGELRLDAGEVLSVPVDLAADYLASYAAAIAHFVDAALHDTPFELSPAWHLGVLRCVEDAYAIAAS